MESHRNNFDRIGEALSDADDDERRLICGDFLSELQCDSDLLRAFKQRLGNPFASKEDVVLLTELLEHTDCTDLWLQNLAGFTILHGKCDVAYRRPLCLQLCKRVPIVKPALLEFLINETSDPDMLVSLIDRILSHLDRFDDQSRRRVVILALNCSSRIEHKQRGGYFDGFMCAVKQFHELFLDILTNEPLTSTEKTILHLSLRWHFKEQYTHSLEELELFCDESEECQWYFYEYCTVYEPAE